MMKINIKQFYFIREKLEQRVESPYIVTTQVKIMSITWKAIQFIPYNLILCYNV